MSGAAVNRRGAVKLVAGAAALPYAGAAASAHATGDGPDPILGPGRDQSFDLGWRFHRGVLEGAEAAGYDDAGWRRVDLPHDWSIEDVPGGRAPQQLGPFDRASPTGTERGFTQGGEGWYRKHFRVAPLAAGGRVEVLFDGIQQTSDVWINGHAVAHHVHGYTPFAIDLTPWLVAGDNVLAVRARNLGHDSRWYAGSGLYRPVTVDVFAASSRVRRWGVAAATRRIEGGRATIDVATELDDATSGLTLRTRLIDARGRVVAAEMAAAAPLVRQALSVPAPRLWSPASPALHTLETALIERGRVIDRVSQPFGIRIIAFSTARGTTINDEPIRLRGGCVHHDNGLLGAAAFTDADERRIRLLKARGFNAIRSAHNPAARSFRAACDRLGMLLIEEAFDAWFAAKLHDDYALHFRDDWRAALAAMVRSARNSPSVMMWSVGNEIPERSTAQGMEQEWRLANEVRRLDPTRPVTAGLNGVLGAEVIAGEGTARAGMAGKPDQVSSVFLDVAGYNYGLDDIERDHARYPERIIYASETFPKDAWDYQALADRAPYMLGEFVWTAMDYIGEAGIGAALPLRRGVPFYLASWPWVIASCGDLDLIGDQRAQSRARDTIWGLSALEIAVQRPVEEGRYEYISPWGWSDELPSWTWPETAGKPLNVRLYTRGDRVELRLNGGTVGERRLTAADKGRAEIAVPYAAGVLEGIAYRGGREIGRRRLETVGAAAAVRLAAETPTGRATRDALVFVRLAVVDAAGRPVPDAEALVTLTIDGPAELAGFGSGAALAVGSFRSPTARTRHGRALAVLRARGRGTVRVEARCDGLAGGAATITLS